MFGNASEEALQDVTICDIAPREFAEALARERQGIGLRLCLAHDAKLEVGACVDDPRKQCVAQFRSETREVVSRIMRKIDRPGGRCGYRTSLEKARIM